MAETVEAVEQKTEEKQAQQTDTEKTESKKQAQSVEFSEAADNQNQAAGASFDILLDMNVPVTVSVGQTDVTVRRLLKLGPGSVLRLDKPVDAPADLYLKDTKFATGNIVVVDGRFAVRIKQVLGLGQAENAEQDTDDTAQQ